MEGYLPCILPVRIRKNWIAMNLPIAATGPTARRPVVPTIYWVPPCGWRSQRVIQWSQCRTT